jgi:hypothetical protein
MNVVRSGVDVVSRSDFLAYQLAPQVPPSLAKMSPLDEHGDFDGSVMRALYEEMKNRGIILDATVDVTYRHPSKKFPPSVVSAVKAAAQRFTNSLRV